MEHTQTHTNGNLLLYISLKIKTFCLLYIQTSPYRVWLLRSASLKFSLSSSHSLLSSLLLWSFSPSWALTFLSPLLSSLLSSFLSSLSIPSLSSLKLIESLSSSLKLLFNALEHNIPDRRTHDILTPWAPVGAKKFCQMIIHFGPTLCSQKHTWIFK